jgi:hypothetical protein
MPMNAREFSEKLPSREELIPSTRKSTAPRLIYSTDHP